jgi:hypothetical protein
MITLGEDLLITTHPLTTRSHPLYQNNWRCRYSPITHLQTNLHNTQWTPKSTLSQQGSLTSSTCARDSEVNYDLLHLKLKPFSDENTLFFWHTGYTHMHLYTRRNICAWHQRFFQQGWIVRVLNRLPSSPFNDANFLNISDPGTFPRAFVDGTIGGDYAPHAHVRPRPVAAPAQVQQCVYGCSDDPDRRLGPPVARNSRQPSRFKVL